MAKPQKSTAQSEVPGLVKKRPLYYLKRDWQLYALMLLPMVFIIVFKYFAYTGLSVAFLDYKIGKGYAGSKFVGLKIFEKVFKHRDFTKAVVNTLLLNVLDLIFSFPMPIILALLLNEIRVKWFKRTTQTLLYLPHFLSWVVIGAVAYQMFATQSGVIKCVFSGYEARMCAGVDAPVHELRFHPYLFPVGLGGAPTFAPGGNPTRDAAEYWNHVRRALLRAKIDRIGLGGYLHLLNDFPDFVEYIADISDEFRAIKELHTHGAVATLPLTVAVLHSWGSLRPWTLSGHFHETYMHTLIHINEALAGLPVNVKFINFDDVKNGVPDDVDVIINAGRAGSAWSGGDAWQDETLVAALNKWVYNGGVLLGVEEPSAVSGYGDTFRMARILGVDEDTGARVCHGRWPVQAEPVDGLIPDGATLKTHDHLYMTDGGTRVLAEVDGTPAIAAHAFGKGRGVYMAGFEYSPVNARMLLNLLLWAKGLPLNSDWLTTDPETEAAWFPADKTLVVINNSTQKKSTVVKTPDGDIAVELDGLETKILPQN